MIKKNWPKPVVDIQYINFGTVRTGTVQKAKVIIRNCGGNYQNLFINVSEPWIKLKGFQLLSKTAELPLKLTIETKCEEAGRIYQGFVVISLDGQTTKVKLRARTRKKRIAAKPPTQIATPPRKPKLPRLGFGKLKIKRLLSKCRALRIKRDTVSKVRQISLVLALVVAVIVGGIYLAASRSTPKKEGVVTTPMLKNLDAWIESTIVPAMTEKPEKWHEHWYNDYVLIGEDLWVIGGVTVTKENYTFESVNFIFHSSDKGESWKAEWSTAKNESVRFFEVDRLEIKNSQEVYVLLKGRFLTSYMVYTTDGGYSWQIYDKWQPGKR